MGVPLLAPWRQYARHSVKLPHGILIVHHVEVYVDSGLQGAASAEFFAVRYKSVQLVFSEGVVKHGVVCGNEPAIVGAVNQTNFALKLRIYRTDYGRRNGHACLKITRLIDRLAVVDARNKHVAAKILVAVGGSVAFKARSVGLVAD